MKCKKKLWVRKKINIQAVQNRAKTKGALSEGPETE